MDKEALPVIDKEVLLFINKEAIPFIDKEVLLVIDKEGLPVVGMEVLLVIDKKALPSLISRHSPSFLRIPPLEIGDETLTVQLSLGRLV
jgi:hypothetical protein